MASQLIPEPVYKQSFARLINACAAYRSDALNAAGNSCWRLFNGFYEGWPGLVVDWFAGHVLLSFHPGKNAIVPQIQQLEELAAQLCSSFPEIQSLWYKNRQRNKAKLSLERIWGNGLPEQITENQLHYAIDLQLGQDNSFYPDTRALRTWLLSNSKGKTVLNTFAYTGSLGLAALGGGAARLVQTDLNPRFLELGRRSASLNGLESKLISLPGNFFTVIAASKRKQRLFDTVILDAPYFSQTRAGTVDLQRGFLKLVNKLRPLVAHEGHLILVNNALYVSGAEMQQQIQELCQSGYLEMEAIVPVPQDCTGYAQTICGAAPANPAPFNHPTKIVILRATRKDRQRAGLF